MKIPSNNKTASWLLRIGLATVLLYAAVSSTVSPNDWIGYMPHFLKVIIPGTTLLHFFSLYELALAIWLIVGYQLKFAALASAATFGGIIATNLGILAITFRDITMVFASLALLFLEP